MVVVVMMMMLLVVLLIVLLLLLLLRRILVVRRDRARLGRERLHFFYLIFDVTPIPKNYLEKKPTKTHAEREKRKNDTKKDQRVVLKRVSARATLKKSLFASVFLCILARESAVAQNLSLSLGNGVCSTKNISLLSFSPKISI